MMESQSIELNIPDSLAGRRLDQALAGLLPDFSRARLQQWIKNGQVLVDGQQWRPKDTVHGGEQVTVLAEFEVQTVWQPQSIPLDIVYEDEAIIVINKPAGMVVHPAAGNPDGTLVNALLHYAPELEQVARGGIIHRLDKDTSGLLVVARTPVAQKYLVEHLQARAMHREYEAIATGVFTAGGTVDAPIARHPRSRMRMAVVAGGKEAVTHYRVIERFRAHTHIRCLLETGRTHQIRVHMAHIHHALLGDPVYGGRLKLPPQADAAFAEALRAFKRQALHAARLELDHPLSGEHMSWQAALPEDMQHLLRVLRADREAHDVE
ncbi:MAG: 23S rRNA pseudouridine(1911/1915/1917) synthase RluD [Granulosicoccaceae bacterium]|jgi:23S rRNA pseudouridine1911/1915/1917 synthase